MLNYQPVSKPVTMNLGIDLFYILNDILSIWTVHNLAQRFLKPYFAIYSGVNYLCKLNFITLKRCVYVLNGSQAWILCQVRVSNISIRNHLLIPVCFESTFNCINLRVWSVIETAFIEKQAKQKLLQVLLLMTFSQTQLAVNRIAWGLGWNGQSSYILHLTGNSQSIRTELLISPG